MDDLWRNPFAEAEEKPHSNNEAHWKSAVDNEADVATSAPYASPTWTADDEVVTWTSTSPPFDRDSHTSTLTPAWGNASTSTLDVWASSRVEDTLPTLPQFADTKGDAFPDRPDDDNVVPTTSHLATPPALSLDEGGFGSIDDEPTTPPTKSPVEDVSVAALESASHSAPPSPDAFGSFESALDRVDEADGADPWSPSAAAFPDDPGDAWGSTWRETRAVPEPQPQKDEWEAAQEKIKLMEERVPSHLLASLLSQWKDVSGDLFPPTKTGKDSDDRWQGGMQSVEGLSTLLETFLPERAVPPILPLSQTHIAKSGQVALRLTKTLPVTRMSPLSYLATSKDASLAWESSVKRQKNVSVDWGWMSPQEKDERTGEEDTNTEKEKGLGAGLLAFFGKKSAPTPAAPPPPPPAPVSSLADPISSRVASPPVASAEKVVAPTSSSPTIAQLELLGSKPASPKPSTPPLPPPAAPTTVAPETTAAPNAQPSAVSRFLNRFSRTKSGNAPSTRSSIALSQADISFLKDVPTMANVNEDEDEFGDLNAMLAPKKSVVTPSLPPTLAPPPKFSARSPPPPSETIIPKARYFDDVWEQPKSPLSPSAPPNPVAPSAAKHEDDFWDAFNSGFTASSSSQSSTVSPSPPAIKTTSPMGPFNSPPIKPVSPSSTTMSSTSKAPPFAASTSSMDDVFSFASPSNPPPQPTRKSIDAFGDFGDFMSSSATPPPLPPPISSSPLTSFPSIQRPIPQPRNSKAPTALMSSSTRTPSPSILPPTLAPPPSKPRSPSPARKTTLPPPLSPPPSSTSPPPPSSSRGSRNSLMSSLPPQQPIPNFTPPPSLTPPASPRRSRPPVSVVFNKPLPADPLPTPQSMGGFPLLRPPAGRAALPSIPSTSMSVSAAPPPSNKPVTKGGLSAQDLSFFEGL